MTDVEVGMERCLDELSFHNILPALGMGYALSLSGFAFVHNMSQTQSDLMPWLICGKEIPLA